MRHIKTVTSIQSVQDWEPNFNIRKAGLEREHFPVPLGYEARSMYIFHKAVSELEATWLGLGKKDSGGRNGKEITPFPPPKRMSTPSGESQEERFRLLTDCITVGPTTLLSVPLPPGLRHCSPGSWLIGKQGTHCASTSSNTQ